MYSLSEMKFLICSNSLLESPSVSPLPRFIAPYLPLKPLLLHPVPSVLSPILFFFCPSFPRLISLPSWIYLFLSCPPWSIYLPLSLSPACLSLSDSFFLSISSLYLSGTIGRTLSALRHPPSLPVCLSPGRAAVMGLNALLIPVTPQNIPADAHVSTLACTHIHVAPIEPTLLLLCAAKYMYGSVNI